MNNKEKDYWSNFYKKYNFLEPSDFAIFINNYFKGKKYNVLDCGCGNGRDSYYLSKNHNVLGIDISNKPKNKNNCTFVLDDFCKYEKKGFDLIYSRFTFHSIENIQQEEFLKNIDKNSYLSIETRSDKLSNIEKVHGETHYRNYTNITYIQNLLKKYNFEILYIDENNGFAKYKHEDPICIRLIAIKK